MIRRMVVRIIVLAIAAAGSGGAWAQETQRQYLSGRDKDDAVPWEFLCTAGRNSNQWTTIPVPSNWELQGFGTFTYGYELKRVPRMAIAVQGQYKRKFQAAADWSGKRVFLVFEGVMTDTEARLNGRLVGPKHQGGYYRFKYEVTQWLNFGRDNLLEVLVDEESSDTSVNAAERRGDYWNFAGIFRPVYLELVPQEFIDRTAIDARADGHLAIDVFTSGVSRADHLAAQVMDLGGRAIGAAFSQQIGQEKEATRLQTTIPGPRLWTAETPSLYQIEVRLMQGESVLHRIRQRFGFRTVEVRPGDGIYLNGARILLKGVNRHTFWPDSGRASSEKLSREDIRLMQDMNMNAVRMSHYPPDQHFLDACDEMGLVVLDELAGWQQRYNTESGRKLVEELVIRDVNHPSILFWDNGNEGGFNTELDSEYGRWDPQHRRVLRPFEKAGDIDTKHYPDFARFQALSAGNMVFMPTELMHGLYDGGAGAGLEDYWEVMRNSPVRGGSFLWSFVDEAVKRVDLDGRLDGRGNLAPDGILGPYREKEGSYYTIKELWSPVAVLERQLPAGFDGNLTVENRYDFTDLQRCSFSWQLRRFRRPNEPGGGFTVVAQGAAKLATPVPPAAKGRLKLDLPKDGTPADALALRADNPDGRELWTWVWPLPHSGDFRKVTAEPGKHTATATETPSQITVHAGDLAVSFSKQTGLLVTVERGGKPFSLINGPRLATGQANLMHIEHRSEGADYLITAGYDGNMKSISWRIRGNGWLQLDYHYTVSGPQDYFGVSFDYPEALVQAMRWMGKGPYRVWKNRLAGSTFGVWENQYNNSITGAGPWKYPEFKGYYSEVRWMQLQTREGPMTLVVHQEDLFVQLLTPEFADLKLTGKTQAPFPAAGVSFLHAIPAVGSKFIAAENSGPQSLKAIGGGDYRGSVSFFFGK